MENQSAPKSVLNAASQFSNNTAYKHPLIEHIIAQDQLPQLTGLIAGLTLDGKSKAEIVETINSIWWNKGIQKLQLQQLTKVCSAYPLIHTAFYISLQQLYGMSTLTAMEGMLKNEKIERAKIALTFRKQLVDQKERLEDRMPSDDRIFRDRMDTFGKAMERYSDVSKEPPAPDESYLDFDNWQKNE